MRVVITGALGNLGSKLIMHLVSLPQITEIVGLDMMQPPLSDTSQRSSGGIKVRYVTCDLSNANDSRWRDELKTGDAVIHFAAQNPFPEASWNDSTISLDMTLNLTLAATNVGVKRFVFASSNHVMGRYKDLPLSIGLNEGQLTTDLPHGVGTTWHTGSRQMDSTAYAIAKSSGERVCRAMGIACGGQTTFVCIRIGWCQPGENLASTLSSAGTPTQAALQSDNPESILTDQWFRNMWLSNRDFAQLLEKAILAESHHWSEPCVVVNGTSANRGAKWSLREAQTSLGYQPVDDVNQ